MGRRTFSLKRILIFSFTLLGALPVLVMGFVSVKFIGADISREVRAKNLLISQSLSAEVQSFLSQGLSMLRLVEDAVVDRRLMRSEEVSAYLDSILQRNLQFEAIVLLDASGTVRHMSPIDENVLGTNLSGQPFFGRVNRERQPYWSTTFISLHTGKPTLVLAIPTKDGVIVGYLNLAALNVVTNRVRAEGLATALIIDREGTIIAHPDPRKVAERENLGHLPFANPRRGGQEGNVSYADDGVEYLASLSFVPQTEWTVVVAVPAHEALALVTRVRMLFGAGSLVVVLMAVAIAFLTLRKVSVPLVQLVRDARKIAEGDYGFQKRPAGLREIDELVDDFHMMAEAVESREKRLKESNETLDAFFNAVHESMVFIDPQGTVLLSNRVGSERLGADVKDFVGTSLYDHFPAEVRASRRAQYETVVTTKKPVYFQDARAGRFFEQRCFPVLNMKGEVRGVAIFAYDITARKQAEEENKRLNTELEQRVRDRTIELEAANKELEAFAYSVSHDLRAPLRAMEGFSSALLSDYRERMDEQGIHYLERIGGASRRMGQLINDLLNLSRISRQELTRKAVDLAALAQEIGQELQSQDRNRLVRLLVAPNLTAWGDARLLRIVFVNLLNNAWKFTGRNEETRIEVGAAVNESGETVYYVKDNGVGFDMAYADKLFAPFQRLHGVNEFPGTGIGLATVQRIVARHGGRVWAEAKVGEGATVHFVLP